MRCFLRILCAAGFLIPLSAQTSPPPVTARMTLTLAHSYGRPHPVLTPADIVVTQRYEPLQVASLTPLSPDRARLEIFVLIDDCANCELGTKFEELTRFVSAQPPNTAIGVAYIDKGSLKIAQAPASDRSLALKALNAPAGSSAASPFPALAELISGWKTDAPRRAVVMVSNGFVPDQDEVMDAGAEKAIEAAERASVPIYAIYNPSADYMSRDYSQVYSGQVHLAHVANETGGEAYFLSSAPLPSLAPFLEDIAEHLANQYLLEFVATPGATAGLQEISVTAKAHDLELIAPSRVWVEGRPGSN